jgi:hypothetical protein
MAADAITAETLGKCSNSLGIVYYRTAENLLSGGNKVKGSKTVII